MFDDFNDYLSEEALWQISEEVKPRGGKKKSEGEISWLVHWLIMISVDNDMQLFDWQIVIFNLMVDWQIKWYPISWLDRKWYSIIWLT